MNREIDILLVEDNSDDIELTLHVLEQHSQDYHVKVVTDGQEALDYIFAEGPYSERDEELLPHVILLDLNMPRIDGFGVMERIRTDPRTHMMPIVVLTSSQEERDVIESHKWGVSSYIQKPVTLAQLNDAVRMLGFHWFLRHKRPKL